MKKIEVVAAVIKRGKKIFATQRGYGEFKDYWEFPGGKIETGEKQQEALVREIKEELDSDIKLCELMCTVDYDYTTFHLTMHCYICELLSGELTLLEHKDSKWLSFEELDSVNWLPADIEVVQKLKEYLEKHEK